MNQRTRNRIDWDRDTNYKITMRLVGNVEHEEVTWSYRTEEYPGFQDFIEEMVSMARGRDINLTPLYSFADGPDRSSLYLHDDAGEWYGHIKIVRAPRA